MKRLFALVLVVALCLSLAATALAAQVQPTKQNITIDGEEVYCPAYNIDGYNYVKLRTLAYLFKGSASPFDVTYDEETKTVTIQRGRPYSGPAEEAFTMVDLSGTAVESAQSIVIDGVERTDLSVWNLGGNNWFKLAELSKAIGFGLKYESATNTAAITTQPMVWNAEDYSAVYNAIANAGGGSGLRYETSGASAAKNAAAEDMAVEAPMPAPTEAEAGGGNYSGTNVQVEGIDEGDIVKTDGKYIYVIHEEELRILAAEGADTREVSKIIVGWSDYDSSESKGDYWYRSENKYPSEMFVADGRLAVLSEYSYYSDQRTADGWQSESKNYTCVDFYDVSDPTSPRELTSLGQDGSILGSRLVDDKLYLITSYWVWNYDESDPATYVPGLYRDGEMHILPVEKIWINPVCESTEYVVACAYDLRSGANTASQSVLGSGDTLYMNDSGIYVLGYRWNDDITDIYTESIYSVEVHTNGARTEILRLDPEELNVSATGSVPGYMESQFSADAYEGYLRLVTTCNDYTYRVYKDDTYGFENYKWDERETTNGLYILDDGLRVVGKVDDLAPGERVYSARFDGDIAYFCTYRNVDPLFAADLSDPTAPKILSALKISGFSEYLHSWSADRLFGLGREVDEESNWAEGLKLVMFDTTDKTNVTVKHTLVIEDAGYSEALYDHKAVFIDPARGYVGFAAEDKYYIYAYDDAAGFQLKYEFDANDYWMSNTRGVRIGEDAYIVNSDQVIVISLADWTWTKTVAIDPAKG